jgi:ABC-type glycerol-3-phosphate transport system substrate-binding protein
MKEEGWELIKWWNSAETQMNYVKNIKMSLGERYMVIPANKEALRQSVWDDEIKNVILEMEEYSMTPAVTPGSYIVEREISQIWNKVVIDKMPVRQAISESVPRINRELKRKLDEFGYINPDGTSSYRVPISSNLGRWLNGN